MSKKDAGKGMAPKKGYNYKKWYENYPADGFKKLPPLSAAPVKNLAEK